MEIKKVSIIPVVLLIWALSLTVYAVNDIWTDYKTQGVQKAYDLGKEDVVLEIINKTKESDCQIFSLVLGDREANLLNAECLPQNQAAGLGGESGAVPVAEEVRQ